MRRSAAALTCLLCSSASASALAMATQGAPSVAPAAGSGPASGPTLGGAPAPAYAPWAGTGYAPPGAPPLGQPPPPSTEGPRFFRRPVELIPQLSLGLPACKSGHESNDRCDGAGGGLDFGFTALWRVAPHFAWGGSLELGFFGYEPAAAERRDAGAAGAWIGLIGRVYFLDEGAIEPWVQLGLGGAALGTSYQDAAGGTVQETGAGPAVQLGAGLDFFLGSHVRLGPHLLVTRVFVDKISQCRGGASDVCSELSKDDHGHFNALAAVGGSLTIMLGDEL
jgi:hypothetical protein